MLHLVRTNTATGGLAEGAATSRSCEAPANQVDRRFDGTVVSLESRYGAVATDDPLARRRQLQLADLAERVVTVDPRTSTTTPTSGRQQQARHRARDVERMAGVLATALRRVTAESTLTQYRRQGVVFRRLRDAPPVPSVSSGGARSRIRHFCRVGLLAERYRRLPS